jgi:hypothetical protein
MECPYHCKFYTFNGLIFHALNCPFHIRQRIRDHIHGNSGRAYLVSRTKAGDPWPTLSIKDVAARPSTVRGVELETVCGVKKDEI